MEISRREYGRSFRRFANSEQPINYNPWNKRFSRIDSDYQPEFSSSARLSHRAAHPYQRNSSSQRTQQSSSSSNEIPSLLNLELPPYPPFVSQDAEHTGENFGNPMRRLEPEQYDDGDEYDDYDDTRPALEENMTEEEYLREEHETKQQIEEIIAVAQALREKLDREEELRRQAEQPIPKLMDLKPKIPSLLDIYVPPPTMISEEICWNCNCPGHRFSQCTVPQQRKFCYRCGRHGYDIANCPVCQKR